jgi:hypothetical protein
MTNTRIDEIKKRAEQATPGPWGQWIEDGDCCVTAPNEKGEQDWLGNVGRAAVGELDVAFDFEKEDTSFIAHAREDIPFLLDRIQELEIEKSQGNYKALFELAEKRIQELEAVRKCDLVLYQNTVKELEVYKKALELTHDKFCAYCNHPGTAITRKDWVKKMIEQAGQELKNDF